MKVLDENPIDAEESLHWLEPLWSNQERVQARTLVHDYKQWQRLWWKMVNYLKHILILNKSEPKHV